MSLSPDQVQTVLSLQQEYFNLAKEISCIKTLIQDLLDHKCEVTYQLTVHNIDRHEDNCIQKEADELINGEDRVRSYLSRGIIKEPPELVLQPCKRGIIFSANESTGILMLNELLKEKNARQEVLQNDIDRILVGELRIVLEATEPQNPLNHLYDGNL